jgi:hypothetical protein
MRRERVDYIDMTIKNEKGQTYETEAKQLYEEDETPFKYLFIFDQEEFYKIEMKLGYIDNFTATDEFEREYRVEVIPCNDNDYELQFFRV